MKDKKKLAFFVLGIGLLVVSSSSILVRYAQAAGGDSLVIAGGRLCLASLVLTPWVLMRERQELSSLARRDLLQTLFAGIFLALHFATWISSLAMTTVASSAALVATTPLWAGLLSVLVFREKLRRGMLLGIILTFAGTLLIMAAQGEAAGDQALWGNLLALSGGVAMAAYLLTGRSVSRKMSLTAYIWLVYGMAGLVLTVVVYGAGLTYAGLDGDIYQHEGEPVWGFSEGVKRVNQLADSLFEGFASGPEPAEIPYFCRGSRAAPTTPAESPSWCW